MAMRQLSWRDALVVGVPAALLVAGAFWLAARYIQPAPPDHLVMSTGPAAGAYAKVAEQYRAILARNGVTLTLLPSAGSVENLARLQAGTADVAFVQGGIAVGAVAAGTRTGASIQSLGALYPEPLWLFQRATRNDSETLAALAHKRVAVGPPGSGTRALAVDLLRLSGVTAANAELSSLSGQEALAALRARTLDAVFVIAAPTAPVVEDFLRSPGIAPVSLTHAGAFARQLEFVTPLVLPRGVVDVQADLPARDISTVAVTANLLDRDVHPALDYLLLDAADEIHDGHSLLADAGTYPNPHRQDVPVASEAERFYKQGKPFLQRYLPYWLANLIDRMLVLLIPIFAVMIPAIKFLPDLYTYRLKSRITRAYGDLRAVEDELGSGEDVPKVAPYLARLDAIEDKINAFHLPSWFASEAYELRSAIDLVRERLGSPGAKTAPELRRKT